MGENVKRNFDEMQANEQINSANSKIEYLN
jgi:hypothetical protein